MSVTEVRMQAVGFDDLMAFAKAGTVSLIGVDGEIESYPIGKAIEKITLRNCNPRCYIPHLLERVRNGTLKPADVLPQTEAMTSVIESREAFDKREPGWIKVMPEPPSEGRTAA